MNLWYSLVGLLPFEWAAPGTMYFMKNALLAILVISPLFGLLSTLVVQNNMAFFSDALGHSAFTGMAIGALVGLMDQTWTAVAFALIFALLFTYVRHRSKMSSDTIIGVFSSAAMALGIFLSTLGGQSFSKFNVLLIGDILSVQPGKIGLLFLILLLILALWLYAYNGLMLSSIHPALAGSRGIRTFLQQALFTAAIAVVVTLSMTWVGLLVINSLLVLPGALSRNLAKNTAQYHLLAVLSAILCGIAGLLTSYYLGTSAGATITLYLALLFFLSLIFARRGR
ncbi:MAG: transporter 3 [Firmicutes bacterium]|nr:transporter 3 [Bacillota bacterium]